MVYWLKFQPLKPLGGDHFDHQKKQGLMKNPSFWQTSGCDLYKISATKGFFLSKKSDNIHKMGPLYQV